MSEPPAGAAGAAPHPERLPRVFAVAAALGFVLFAVLDLTGHGSGAVAKLVVLASVACVAALRFLG